MSSAGILTNGHGAPIDDDQNSLTVGSNGPILLTDVNLIDKLAHFDRERIPERVVHAKGAGAHGYFEVTADVSKYTKAKYLNKVGKRTPVFVRFSTVGGEKGSADAVRDPRGFAIKHYTEEGVFDMVGNNTPIFFIRDPQLFPQFIHTQKRHPQTNLKSADMIFDFASQIPESVHQFMFLFSDRGTPLNYRNMNGYSSHTLKWVNAKDEAFWIKLHYKPVDGVKNFKDRHEANAMEAKDPDHATRDLFEHIQTGKEAVWDAFVQVIPFEEGFKYKYNIFDVTKVVPHKDYPLIKYGRLVLNRNPINYFAEVEQSAFSPSHLVPGVEPSFDRMFQARMFSYPDTHRHRLGPNYLQIPINCPLNPVVNQQRDGFMTVNGNGGLAPNFMPNTLKKDALNPISSTTYAAHKHTVSGAVGRFKHDHPNNDFEQPGHFWRNVLKEDERTRLVDNFVDAISGARKEVQARQIEVFAKVDKEFARRVADDLKKKSSL